jgi:urease accessory protein
MDIIMDEGATFPWLARLLQVNDSAFPTGGYAHSYGFEQTVRMGLVRDAESMGFQLENHLWPMLIHFELPVVRFAQEAALDDDQAALPELDACVDATKTARELREASRATGRRRLHAFGETGPSPTLTAFAREVEEGRSPGHHAVVYGIGLAHLPPRALLTSWAFQSLSAVCLAVSREELGWFDPLVEIASMQHEIAYERLFIS